MSNESHTPSTDERLSNNLFSFEELEAVIGGANLNQPDPPGIKWAPGARPPQCDPGKAAPAGYTCGQVWGQGPNYLMKECKNCAGGV
jgi:hypothetical protein